MTDASDPSAERRRRAERQGLWAERLAEILLRLKGYRILDRRYRTKVGEIDLIARRGKRLAFVEVKRRKSQDEALDAITRNCADACAGPQSCGSSTTTKPGAGSPRSTSSSCCRANGRATCRTRSRLSEEASSRDFFRRAAYGLSPTA